MDDLTGGILIVGIITLGIYRLFELYVRRKERMAIIEKLGEQIKLSEANVDLNLPIFRQSNGNWALKISLLLVGVGIGLLIAWGIEFAATNGQFKISGDNWKFNHQIGIVYFASAAIFGGIGLLIAYFIELKNNRKGD